MHSLSDLQSSMAQALLAVEPAQRSAVESWFSSPDAARAGLHVHRNTVLGACWNSLRLSYPALERWLGTTTFEALAADFARERPPRSAALGVYGEEFAAYVAGHLPAESRPLAADIANLDWACERVAQCAPGFAGGLQVALEGGARLSLAPSLRLCRTSHSVDTLRDELLTGTTAQGSSAGREPLQLALWHTADGLNLRRLHPPAAALVAQLLSGATLALGLEAAAEAARHAGIAPEALGGMLEDEVLRAGFAQLNVGGYPQDSMESQ